MDELTEALAKHRQRLGEIMTVLGRYGLADWADQQGIAGVKLARRLADPTLAALSPGERMRGAAVELGTTFIKFGQMLSLRPDAVGTEVAAELEQLQGSVPPDPPDVARRIVTQDLGSPLEELFTTFEADAMGVGLRRAGPCSHAAPTAPRSSSRCCTTVRRRTVRDDLDLMRALGAVPRATRSGARALSPDDDRVGVRQDDAWRHRPAPGVREPPALHGQLRRRARRRHPDGVPQAVEPSRRHHAPGSSGNRSADRATLEAAGWDVDTLVRRATEIYLEMIFRDSLFHADPHPGNFLLLEGRRIGILDFGDVGYVSAPRRAQLEDLVIAVGTRNVDELIDTIWR